MERLTWRSICRFHVTEPGGTVNKALNGRPMVCGSNAICGFNAVADHLGGAGRSPIIRRMFLPGLKDTLCDELASSHPR